MNQYALAWTRRIFVVPFSRSGNPCYLRFLLAMWFRAEPFCKSPCVAFCVRFSATPLFSPYVQTPVMILGLEFLSCKTWCCIATVDGYTIYFWSHEATLEDLHCFFYGSIFSCPYPNFFALIHNPTPLCRALYYLRTSFAHGANRFSKQHAVACHVVAIDVIQLPAKQTIFHRST